MFVMTQQRTIPPRTAVPAMKALVFRGPNQIALGELVQTLVDQAAGTVIPNWTTPNTSVSLPMVDFPSSTVYNGKWSGKLRGGGTETAVFLEITPSGSATLSLGDKGPEKVTSLRLQGNALVGKSVGKIESADAIRNHATSFDDVWQDCKLSSGRISAFQLAADLPPLT